MKLIIFCLLLVGCSHTVPRNRTDFSQKISVVPVVTPVVTPAVQVESPPMEEEKVVKTWLTKEDLQSLHEAMRAAVERDSCKCLKGDPLCSCL